MKIDTYFLHTLPHLAALEKELESYSLTEKQETLNFTLNDDEFIQKKLATVFDLKHFVSIFCGEESKNIEMENIIFEKMLNTHFIQLFNSVFSFTAIYECFVHNQLTDDEHAHRSLSLLNLLTQSEAYNQLKNVREVYLADLISMDSNQKDQIIKWAKDNQLIQSNEELNAILNIVQKHKNKIKIEIEEEQKKPLFTKQDDATALIRATKNGDTSKVLELISKGTKVNVQDKLGYKPSLFRLFYSCDHDSDDGECIILKKIMDKPIKSFISRLESLEEKYLNKTTGLFNFDEIKHEFLSIIKEKEFQNPKPLQAICGYIINNVDTAQKEAVLQFFNEHSALYEIGSAKLASPRLVKF